MIAGRVPRQLGFTALAVIAQLVIVIIVGGLVGSLLGSQVGTAFALVVIGAGCVGSIVWSVRAVRG